MSCLGWNCRGLANPRAIRFLRDLARRLNPSFIFLCETMINEDRIIAHRDAMGFEESFVVDSERKKGGLEFLWRANYDVSVLGSSKNFVDLRVKEVEGRCWRLTGFYGCPEHSRRRDSWAMLTDLSLVCDIPWCAIDNFNDILDFDEKRGGIRQEGWLVNGFRETVANCGLSDIGASGYKFTWSRGRGGSNLVEECLDRVLCSSDWMEIFPEAGVSNLEATISHHLPILLSFKQNLSMTKNVKRTNCIDKLRDEEGCWKYSKQKVEGIISRYYSNLFSESNSDVINFGDVIQRVSHLDNVCLINPITESEVGKAVFSMHNDKSPGLYGFNPTFYKKYWAIVGKDVVTMCRDFFEKGVLRDGLNDTNLVLIPKISNPERVSDLRPIALCNVAYKIIFMANRMKCLLTSIISENQSAFVENRLTTDNFLIAYEIGHYLRCKRRGKVGMAALKIDMSKAYDRVRWDFIDFMLRNLGFCDKWINLIMYCVRSVKYTNIGNCENLAPIIPSRGLRQDDLLSPYLFIICAEGLSLLLAREEMEGRIYGCWDMVHVPSLLDGMTVADWIFRWLTALAREEGELIALICWHLWLNRSSVVWNKKSSTVGMIVAAAVSQLTAWRVAHHPKVEMRLVDVLKDDGRVSWIPPDQGWIKDNVDAANFSNGLGTGVGIVVRDWRGSVLQARHVRFQADAMEVILDIGNPKLAEENVLVGDCAYLAKQFSNVIFIFVSRSANQAAHVLAQNARSISDHQD
ncbi:uncharacterized protein LOC126668167 [Mercurialis annua]|uniref:uncharacterized protein LOC126668167 n=1 Tax=Mercurialis annua TaxID=3986 RepID=UPI0021608F1D|nr:uncharacterized protein LOC126668167 [Mercurialis annua]